MAFNISPLRAEWSMPKLKDDNYSEQELGLIRLKYTYKFESMLGEPCDECLKAIEDKCNEVIGNFNEKEDEALTIAFRAGRIVASTVCST